MGADFVDDEILAKDELFELAEALHAADKMEKEGKLAKENVRGPFFELITEVVRDEVQLQRQTVEVEADEDWEVETWRAQNYPEWRVVAINGHSEGMSIVLEENEAFKKYEFVHDGFRFGRTIRMEGAGFEVEQFYQDLLDAYDPDDAEVLEDLLSCVEKQEVVTYSIDEKKLQKVMKERPETVAWVQRYINPGVPKPALLPIKKAKEEDEE
jgi:hypothetical protein